MAKFHIGQRVRVVNQDSYSVNKYGSRIGMEAVIVAIPGKVDQCSILIDLEEFDADFYQLAPLTDPLAEKFIESIKLLGPLEEREVA